MNEMNRNGAPPRKQRRLIRSAIQARQGTGPRVMIWVLLFSILLAVIVGGVLLSGPGEIKTGGVTNAPAAGRQQQ